MGNKQYKSLDTYNAKVNELEDDLAIRLQSDKKKWKGDGFDKYAKFIEFCYLNEIRELEHLLKKIGYNLTLENVEFLIKDDFDMFFPETEKANYLYNKVIGCLLENKYRNYIEGKGKTLSIDEYLLVHRESFKSVRDNLGKYIRKRIKNIIFKTEHDGKEYRKLVIFIFQNNWEILIKFYDKWHNRRVLDKLIDNEMTFDELINLPNLDELGKNIAKIMASYRDKYSTIGYGSYIEHFFI